MMTNFYMVIIGVAFVTVCTSLQLGATLFILAAAGLYVRSNQGLDR